MGGEEGGEEGGRGEEGIDEIWIKQYINPESLAVWFLKCSLLVCIKLFKLRNTITAEFVEIKIEQNLNSPHWNFKSNNITNEKHN